MLTENGAGVTRKKALDPLRERAPGERQFRIPMGLGPPAQALRTFCIYCTNVGLGLPWQELNSV